MPFREDWQSIARNNTDRLASEVQALEDELRKGNFGGFWTSVKAVSISFKELKPTLTEERNRLWNTFSQLCSQAKSEQSRHRAGRADVSRQKRDLVESKLTEAYWQAKGAETGQALRAADSLLQEALDWMKDGYSGFNIPTQYFALNDGKMLKEDHDACWKRWQEIKELIKFRRQNIFNTNYNAFLRDAYDAKALVEHSPKDAKERVRTIQQDLKGHSMEKWQFEEIRSILEDVYQRASAVQKIRHETWERKQQEWRSRLQSAKSAKYELKSNKRAQASKIERQIDHDRDLLSGAKSADFESRVQGWIDEKLDKLRAIERFIGELEDQIREIEEKLRRS
ncbi:MAG TPA: hypothetical protein VMF91_03975 [Bryobacteraceae bacterium]|nr:hypothetical protein [Bryobacteraceae bacterium]